LKPQQQGLTRIDAFYLRVSSGTRESHKWKWGSYDGSGERASDVYHRVAPTRKCVTGEGVWRDLKLGAGGPRGRLLLLGRGNGHLPSRGSTGAEIQV